MGLGADALYTSADRTARVLSGENLDFSNPEFYQNEYQRLPTWSNSVSSIGQQLNNAKTDIAVSVAAYYLSQAKNLYSLFVCESETSPNTELIPDIPENKPYVYPADNEFNRPQILTTPIAASLPTRMETPYHEPSLEDFILTTPDQSGLIDRSPYLRAQDRDGRGRFKASTDIPEGRLNRAYPWADTKLKIQEQAKAQDLYNPDTGNYIDPNTGLEIEGQFHYGHTIGNESWRSRDEATRKGMSQAEYNESQQNIEYW